MRCLITTTFSTLVSLSGLISQFFEGAEASSVSVSAVSISPDWMWWDSPTRISVLGDFSMPPGYRILSTTASVSSASGVEINVQATSNSDSVIIFDFPGLPHSGEYFVALVVTGGTYTGDNVFQVEAQKTLRLAAVSEISGVGSVSVGAGPPRGGTLIGFSFSTAQTTDLDCAFGPLRTPVTFVSTTGSTVRGSCFSPMMEFQQYLCVQLVPRHTVYLMYPSNYNSGACYNSFPFRYYDFTPFPTSIVPTFGIGSGGGEVELRGFNFPIISDGLDEAYCRFGSVQVTATVQSSTSAVCSSYPPAPVSTNRPLIVDVSISFNSGVDYTPIKVPFRYVPVASISAMTPSFGIGSGNTLLSVDVSYAANMGVPGPGPQGLCFHFPSVGSPTISHVLTPGRFATPPYPSSFPSVASVDVDVTILQEDGTTCGPNPVVFTYVPDWGGSRVTPSVITGGSEMTLSVTGSNFITSPASCCVARPVWPLRSGLQAAYSASNLDCSVRGSLTVATSSSSVCHLDLGSKFYECAYAVANQVINAQGSENLLWESGIEVEIAVSMNGVDFATVEESEAGTAQPVFVRAVRLPLIASLSPPLGYDTGGYIVQVSLETGVSWYVTWCVFTSSLGVSREVRASPYSLKTVACTVPQWYLGSETSVEVQVQLRVNDFTLSPPAVFRFVRSPSISTVAPFEGTAGVSCELSIAGSGFRNILNGSFQCIFAKTYLSTAIIVSDSLIQCASPSDLSSPGTYTLDISVNWAVDESNRETYQVALHQGIFTVQSSQIGHVTAQPLTGPAIGGTTVVFTITGPSSLQNSGLLRCGFGKIIQNVFWISDISFSCVSPALIDSVGSLPLSVSLEGQTLVNVGIFTFYAPESIASIKPTSGLAVGGSLVLIRGAHFVDSPHLVCRFGLFSVTPVVKFVTSQLVMCHSPPGVIGFSDVAISNNGQDFNAVLPNAFNYVQAMPLLRMLPFLGPFTGGTPVLIQAPAHFVGPMLPDPVTCAFGSYTVPATPLADGSIKCTTPAVIEPMTVTVTVAFESQITLLTDQEFVFYPNTLLDAVVPPMGPQGTPNTVTIQGSNFYNSEYLTVRFGTVNVGFVDTAGVWISSSEIRVNTPSQSPSSSFLRLPVMVSNNGIDYVPSTLNEWNPDDDSFQLQGVVQYYTFHLPILLSSVDPPMAEMHGGGYVSVHGGPFLATSTTACGFDRFIANSNPPILVSSTHILCPVPDLWAAGAPVVSSVKLQIALVPDLWSESFLNFNFVTSSPVGSFNPPGTTLPCRPGFMCDSYGQTQPMQCPPGTFQSYFGQTQCTPCTKGFYCPQARQIAPVVCPGGWVCDEENLVIPHRRCPAGFICLQGTSTSDPVPSLPGSVAPYRCLQGMYCLEGTAALVSVPGNYSTPQPCYQSAYCKPGSTSPFGAGSIPLGRFSPTPFHPGILCPPRFFCGPVTGNVEPRPCAAGTYNSLYGQHNCTLAYEGSMAPAAMMLSPVPSDCGYFAGRKGIGALTEWDLCPSAMVCGFGTASDSDVAICSAVSSYSECSSFMNYYAPNTIEEAVKRVDPSLGNCCWNNSKVLSFIESTQNIVASSGQQLEALAMRRFRQKVQAANATLLTTFAGSNGFDGLVLLEQVTRATLATAFNVHIERVREGILFEIERHFSFRAPTPCAPGVFCNRGTCAGLAPVITVSVQR